MIFKVSFKLKNLLLSRLLHLERRISQSLLSAKLKASLFFFSLSTMFIDLLTEPNNKVAYKIHHFLKLLS